MHFVIPWWPWWSLSSISLCMGFGIRIRSPFSRTHQLHGYLLYETNVAWDVPTLLSDVLDSLFVYAWACNAPSEYEPIPPEALPCLGHGLAVCPLQRSVRQPAGPRRPHLLGFITWTSQPCRPESFLLKWAHTCVMQNSSDRESLTITRSRSSSRFTCMLAAKVVPKLYESSGTITQAGRDLCEFSPS